jgi:hypothetical protein
MKHKKDILICDCHSTEHQIVVYYSEDSLSDGTTIPSCYLHVHLNSQSFWKRLVYGVKYIFGYKSRFGAWDEMILNPDDADKIQEIANYLKHVEDRNK